MRVAPNQLIEMQMETMRGPKSFRTRVEDSFDDLVIVGAPIEGGTLVPLQVGSTLEVEFTIREGYREGRYTSTAIVEKRFGDQVRLVQLRLLKPWIKTQQRMFVRVPVFLNAVLNPVIEGEEIKTQAGIILNLSGGGFCLRTDYSFELGDLTKITFDIETDCIANLAEVRRLIVSSTDRDFGFSFVDMSERVRQSIIQYVFKRQLELVEKSREEQFTAR